MSLRHWAWVASTCAVACSIGCATTSVSPAVRRPLSQTERGWNTLDAELMAGAWWDDGTIVNSLGVRTHGRPAIEEHFARIFEHPTEGISHRIHIETARTVTPRVAIVDGRIERIHREPSGDVAQVRVVRYTATIVRRRVRWKLSDVHVYLPPSSKP